MDVDEATPTPAAEAEPEPIAEEDAQAEITDPDDIDALLESMDVDEATPTPAAEAEPEPIAEEDAQTEITDPDDIDALLESMDVDEATPTPAAKAEPEPIAEEDAQTEITDPDDIDALLESMDVDEATPTPAAKAEPEPIAEEDAQTEITDPDDIDALLESMNIEEAEPAAKAEPIAEEDAQTEITDPDDIDALLESMNIEKAEPAAEADPLEEEDAQTEITDPNDIDALLESMNIEEAEPAVKADPFEDEYAQTELTDPDDIDALLESMNIDVPDQSSATVKEDTPEYIAQKNLEISDNSADVNQTNVSENKEKIESLTEEYVAPLLSADFSDILAKTAADELIGPESTQESTDLVAEEDFDIDALIADAGQSTEYVIEKEPSVLEEESYDIGDDLISETFDENTLAELLNDESELAVELSPDFSDQNVLADLLNDNEAGTDNQVSEANEINDIQELDNLDFDELLANIEEESSIANQPADFNQNLNVGDEITLEDFDNFKSNANAADSGHSVNDEEDESFVSVDSLLLASQDEINTDEPYEKVNIDVGLNEFPEFTGDVNQIDVDVDENGVAAKLDLAKVYLEIGDQDNAVVILKEVIKLGDPQQQAEAQDLLNNF